MAAQLHSKFWSAFPNDPQGSQRSASFPSMLWKGISNEARPQVWTLLSKRDPTAAMVAEDAATRFDADLLSDITSAVHSELDHSARQGLSPRLSDERIDQVLRIVLSHAERNELREYREGVAQLAATVLDVTQSELATAGLLQHCTTRMTLYQQSGSRLMMNDVLVLADVLVEQEETGPLADHFNAQGFDVVDLSDIVRTWCLAMLASYFPSYAVKRLVDILLFEEPVCLIAIIFGVLRELQPTLLTQTGDELYSNITNAPPSLTEEQLDRAFAVGYEVFRIAAVRVDGLRKQKDWKASLVQPGALKFVKGVGTRGAGPKSLSGKDLEQKLGAVFSEQKKRDVSKEDTRADADADAGDKNARLPDVIFRLEKVRRATLDQTLHQLLEEAAKQLRRQHETLQTLQIDLKHQEERLLEAGMSPEASSAESSVYSDEEEEEETSGDEERRRRRRTIMRKEAPLPPGAVRHSKLFQHQQFPCLYMEGYLLKARFKPGAGQGDAGTYGTSHRRFFILQGSFLTYFKSHRSSKPSRDVSIDMRKRTVKKLSKHKYGKYGFEISEVKGKGSLYLLFASSSDERNVWQQVLNAAAES